MIPKLWVLREDRVHLLSPRCEPCIALKSHQYRLGPLLQTCACDFKASQTLLCTTMHYASVSHLAGPITTSRRSVTNDRGRACMAVYIFSGVQACSRRVYPYRRVTVSVGGTRLCTCCHSFSEERAETRQQQPHTKILCLDRELCSTRNVTPLA